ncbi:MAG: GIY-YIG nuclease family protein [Desulfitobacterium sp.]|nr:GIY-YIG nuclease family protein [Desulfitobacterium sp.]
MENRQCLQEKLKNLPSSPGIYLMKDSLGNVIYVGKGKNLKNRVSQYFHNQKDREPKVEEMIQNIRDFEYRVLDTELDALLEECRLIKEIKPLYNRQMKNEKKYVYLKIPQKDFPKLEIVHAWEGRDDGALYYGPFNSRNQVEKALEFFNDYFLLRKCTTTRPMNGGNGCLYRELETCLGVCTGKVSQEKYRVQIQALCQVIEGKDKSVNKRLKEEIKEASEELEFEKAGSYKQYLMGVKYIQGRQKFLRSIHRNRSVLLLEFLDEYNTRAKAFLIRGNKLIMSRVVHFVGKKYTFNKLDLTNNELFNFLKEAQLNLKSEILESEGNGNPRQLTSQEVDEAQIIYSYLNKKEGVFTFPVTKKMLKEEDFPEKFMEHILRKIP